MYPPFQQTFVYILYTKLKELWQLNVLPKMYTKVCRKVGYILYTSILIYKKCTSKKLCIQFVHKIQTECIIQIVVCKVDPTFQHTLICLLCTS